MITLSLPHSFNGLSHCAVQYSRACYSAWHFRLDFCGFEALSPAEYDFQVLKHDKSLFLMTKLCFKDILLNADVANRSLEYIKKHFS